MPIQRQRDSFQRRSSDRPTALEGELAACLERVLRVQKAETVAASVDRKKSTVYRWQIEPGDVPIKALFALASFDPDPDLLPRIAGILLSHVAASALTREAQHRATIIVQEISPGRWGR